MWRVIASLFTLLIAGRTAAQAGVYRSHRDVANFAAAVVGVALLLALVASFILTPGFWEHLATFLVGKNASR
ncbi:MAG: hypothetical protein JO054_03105 [Actinobacteria bacterium]|nr:hypothetical protein [Actinomycetota bacterium]